MFENQIDDSVRQFKQRLVYRVLTSILIYNIPARKWTNYVIAFVNQQKKCKNTPCFGKIAQTENITPTDEEIEEEYNKLAEQYKIDVEKIKSFILKADLSKDLSVQKHCSILKTTQ